MSIPARLKEFLDSKKVKYEVIKHPAAYTAQELAAVEHVKGRRHAKVVIVKSDGGHLMAVLPADHRVDLKKLDELTGQRTLLATEAEFKSLFPDCEPGTMPPFGALYNLPMLVEKSLAAEDEIVFEAGTHTEAVRMKWADFEKLAQPKLAEFAVKLR
jgi:Ala-tRNA(Pro) deacylase